MSRSLDARDTIVAVATPPGRGALGTVRWCGPAARELARRLFRPWSRESDPFEPGRSAVPGTAQVTGADGTAPEDLDRGVMVFFPAALSPVGDDLVEITLHGSPVILRRLLEAAVSAGARPALPGEFSYRALLHGRLDATQAEAIDDLVRARTEHQARVAYRQQTGALSQAVEPARRRLVDQIARLEANIEFSATEAEDFVDAAALRVALDQVTGDLDDLLASARRGLRLHGGGRVVFAGPVNSGKSTIFNYLAGFARAIVDPLPGTTRDVLEAEVDWDGLPVVLVDTAGDRADTGGDPVEAEGQRRGEAQRREADLVLWVQDVTVPGATPVQATGAPTRLRVLNKIDLLPESPSPADSRAEAEPGPAEHRVSALTGAGLEVLRADLVERLAPGWDSAETPLVTRVRQQGCLQSALTSARDAVARLDEGAGEEVVVLHLQRCLAELTALTGRGNLEEIYDRVFSSFCIGK